MEGEKGELDALTNDLLYWIVRRLPTKTKTLPCGLAVGTLKLAVQINPDLNYSGPWITYCMVTGRRGLTAVSKGLQHPVTAGVVVMDFCCGNCELNEV